MCRCTWNIKRLSHSWLGLGLWGGTGGKWNMTWFSLCGFKKMNILFFRFQDVRIAQWSFALLNPWNPHNPPPPLTNALQLRPSGKFANWIRNEAVPRKKKLSSGKLKIICWWLSCGKVGWNGKRFSHKSWMESFSFLFFPTQRHESSSNMLRNRWNYFLKSFYCAVLWNS